MVGPWFWETQPHEKLYGDLHTGPGIGAFDPIREFYAELRTAYQQVFDDLTLGLRRLDEAHDGAAADAGHSGIESLCRWAEEAVIGAHESSVRVQGVADAFATAHSTMPKPVKVTAVDGPWDNFMDFFGAITPREAEEAAARAAHAEAIRTMSRYVDAGTADAMGMPVWSPPQPVTVEVTEPVPATTERSGVGGADVTAGSGRSVDTSWTTTAGDPTGQAAVRTPAPVVPAQGPWPPAATVPTAATPGTVIGPMLSVGRRPAGGGSGASASTGTGGVGTGGGAAVGRGSGPGRGGGRGPGRAGGGGEPAGGRGGGAQVGRGEPAGGRGWVGDQAGRAGDAAAGRGPVAGGRVPSGGAVGGATGSSGGTGSGGVVPPSAGARREDGDERERRYPVDGGDVFDDDRRVAPAVIGEELPR